MFTGIIESLGNIHAKEKQQKNIVWTIKANFCQELKLGDSVSINGACHTVTDCNKTSFQTESMLETVNKTSLQSLRVGSFVNLERSLLTTSRIDGHFVQGHIDGTGEIINILVKDGSWQIDIKTDSNILDFCIYKGSIAIDGVSLTLTDVDQQSLTVNIIPHTWDHTIFSKYEIGDIVNIETDILARYFQKWQR